MEKGIFKATKKDKTEYYRVSITKNGKHISLGSYEKLEDAKKCYAEASNLISDHSISIGDYNIEYKLNFNKFVTLINFRDNNIYLPNPIYLKAHYLEYYLTNDIILKFDREELFFFSKHKIFKRGNHLFYSDYGMQVNLLEKFGIHAYSIEGIDYRFINQDRFDFRSSNIDIINHYHGVKKSVINGKIVYSARIHINGYYKIGDYNSELKACIAYNKAVDELSKHINTKYKLNYPDISPKEYASIYSEIKISDKLIQYINSNLNE